MINPRDANVNQFFKGFRLTDEGGYQDPTMLGFKLLFDFNPHQDHDAGGTTSCLFAPAEDLELDSAERYLKAIGHPQKAKMVVEFKKMLQYINKSTPWYFQSIEGVNELWKLDMKEFDPYRGKDKYLTINCLESIDLRITAMADLYRKFAFDYKFMRELLPHNLRQFTVYIMVGEIRKFHSLKTNTNLQNLDSAASLENGNFSHAQDGNNLTKEFQDLDSITSIMMFKCGKCEFDFSESYPSEILNMGDGTEMAKQKFKIKVGKISEENTYSLLDLLLKDGSDAYNHIGKGINGAELTDGDSPMPKELGSAYNPTNPSVSSKQSLGSAFNSTNPLQAKLNRAVNGLGENAFGKVKDSLLTTNIGGFIDAPINSLITSVFGNQVLGNAYNKDILLNKKSSLGTEDVYPNSPGTDLGLPDRVYKRADE